MSSNAVEEGIELAGPTPKLKPKEWVDKRLADEAKTRNPQTPEKIAQFLATQAGATDNLIELLNRITGLSLEEKRVLIDESCKSTNEWAGYTHGRWPGDKGKQINPNDYYNRLNEAKQELAKKLKEKSVTAVKFGEVKQPASVKKV